MGSQTPVEEGLFSGRIFFVSKNDLKDGPNTPGQNRKTALSPDGLWVGECTVTAYDQPSQWHHHKDYDSVMYMLSGRIRVDWGPNGEKSFELGPGDYAFMGRKAIHRAHIIESDGDCRYIFVRIGQGESVVNVDGPGFATDE